MTTTMSPYQQFIHQTRYARWLETEKRRETWEETVDRYINFFKQERANTPELQALLDEAKQAILAMQVMPSMRALMTAGEALKRENIAGYNCCFIAINNKRAFAEALYVLMCGTGVGFSCERQEVAKLPVVPESLQPSDDVIVVGDSKEGWAKAYAKLLSALYTGDIPQIDYSKLRPQGARLKTFGGRASGSKPLQKLFEFTINKFKHSLGKKLTSIDVHDIMCMVGEIVVVGGVRRSALISLSNLSDHRMRDAKSGQWWQDNPQRGLSNNSVAYTEKPSAEIFMEEWLALVKSKSGERGIFNRVAAQNQAAKYGRRNPNHSYGTNPCCEVILRDKEFCVAGDTLLQTEKGIYPIKDLVGTKVKVWNGDKWSQVEPIKTGSNQQLLRVSLSDGSFLDTTPDHRWSVKHRFQDKWSVVKTVDLLSSSDYVLQVQPTKVTWPTESSFNIKDAYTLGAIVGDGCVYKGKVLLDLFGEKTKLPVIGTRHTLTTKGKSNIAYQRVVIKDFDVESVLSLKTDADSLLKAVATWDRQSFLSFVAGLADTDGSVTQSGGIRIYLTGEQRARNMQMLLTRAGIKSSVNLCSKKGTNTNYGVRKDCLWYVQVSDAREIPCHRLDVSKGHACTMKGKYQSIRSVTPIEDLHDSYCFEEFDNHMGLFGNVLTYQCNLTEVIVRVHDDINTLSEKVRIATILGTFQASLTKFNFLSETWTKNTEEEALLGVSMTGIMDNLITSGQYHTGYLEQMLEHLRSIAVEVNKQVAELLGIKPSAAITCVKPSGTVSQLCDTASGIHARHNSHYIRTVRIDKKDPVYALLKHQGIPIEDDVMRPDSTAVVSFPQVAPQGCVTRNDMTALEQLELWLVYQRNWCEHKPSVTITVKEDEWVSVGAWVYEHFDEVSGISFLPHSDHTYQQAPYQDMTEESLNQWIKDNPSPVIDWSMLPMFEKEDETVSSQTLACVSGMCEI